MTAIHGHGNGAGVQDLRTLRRQFKHLLVGDHIELAGLGNDARITGEDTVHVGEDVAPFGIEAGGKRHRAQVRSAAAPGW